MKYGQFQLFLKMFGPKAISYLVELNLREACTNKRN